MTPLKSNPLLFHKAVDDTLKQLYTDCQAAVDVNGTYTAFF